MSRVSRGASRRAATAVIVAVLMLASGCSASGGAGSGGSASFGHSGATLPTATIPTQTRDAAAAALVPKSVASKGKLVFGMDATYPPLEFLSPGGTKIIGMDADLGVAIAQVLGLEPVLRNMGFDAIITGMLANRYDVGLSAFTDTDQLVTVWGRRAPVRRGIDDEP